MHNLFLVYLSIPTCFGLLCAHHQEKQLCLCDTWYLLFCVDDCPVCIPDQVGLITRDHMKFAVNIVVWFITYFVSFSHSMFQCLCSFPHPCFIIIYLFHLWRLLEILNYGFSYLDGFKLGWSNAMKLYIARAHEFQMASHPYLD